jgi:AraC family transcriptional regulator
MRKIMMIQDERAYCLNTAFTKPDSLCRQGSLERQPFRLHMQAREGSAALYDDIILSVLFDVPCIKENKISLAGVAAQFNLSANHFHIIFKRHSGENFAAYSRRVRLEYAARCLRRKHVSLIEIALLCGYESHEGFSRAFKQHFGMTPQAMRVQMHSLDPTLIIPASAIRCEVIPDQTVLRLRHIGPYDALLEPTKNFMRLVRQHHGQEAFSRPFILYHDDPAIPMHVNSRAEICCLANQPGPPVPGLQKVTLPGGRYRIYRHHGPYHSIHAAFVQFASQSANMCNYDLTDHVCRVDYIAGSARKDAGDVVSDICLRANA